MLPPERLRRHGLEQAPDQDGRYRFARGEKAKCPAILPPQDRKAGQICTRVLTALVQGSVLVRVFNRRRDRPAIVPGAVVTISSCPRCPAELEMIFHPELGPCPTFPLARPA